MKFLVLGMLISVSAFAQFPNIPVDMSALKDISKQVLEACKEDKSKIKGCESYTELSKLKVCLLENKEKLSSKCKNSLKL
ncbi:MAG: hypothetical protein NDI69_10765 [Bacteriovoracaceae bacterium]|nr:hypothetical protein [Bacteriovoracaceae bacterium]